MLSEDALCGSRTLNAGSARPAPTGVRPASIDAMHAFPCSAETKMETKWKHRPLGRPSVYGGFAAQAATIRSVPKLLQTCSTEGLQVVLPVGIVFDWYLTDPRQ